MPGGTRPLSFHFSSDIFRRGRAERHVTAENVAASTNAAIRCMRLTCSTLSHEAE